MKRSERQSVSQCFRDLSTWAPVGGLPGALLAAWTSQTRFCCPRRTVRRLRGADSAQYLRVGQLDIAAVAAAQPYLAAVGILMPPQVLHGNRDVLS